MSDTDQIFFKSDLDLPEVTVRIADGMDFDIVRFEDGISVYRKGYRGLEGTVGGAVLQNDVSVPEPREQEDRAIYDDYPYYWEIWISRPGGGGRQESLARMMFEDFVKNFQWSCILTRNADLVLARWSPEKGLEDFPVGTSVDLDGISIWGAE
ncbi:MULTISPECIES: hypothetical protein [unclassified Frankia]|uniref:hypothetical protein n=1 Tax=unclassified Frankia TaxID=2632575 RepID=UPI002023F697